MRCLRGRGGEHGAAAVEFALVVSLLLTLVLGILEYGWLFNGWITVTGAAREGARVAAVNKDDSDVASAVLKHSLLFPTAPSVRVDRESDPDAVTVTVTGRLQPLVGFFRSTDWEIPADATMRREYSQ